MENPRKHNHKTESKGWDYVEVRNRANLDSSSPTGGTRVKREITLTWALHSCSVVVQSSLTTPKGISTSSSLENRVGTSFTLLILESSELLNADLHTIIIFT